MLFIKLRFYDDIMRFQVMYCSGDKVKRYNILNTLQLKRNYISYAHQLI